MTKWLNEVETTKWTGEGNGKLSATKLEDGEWSHEPMAALASGEKESWGTTWPVESASTGWESRFSDQENVLKMYPKTSHFQAE